MKDFLHLLLGLLLVLLLLPIVCFMDWAISFVVNLVIVAGLVIAIIAGIYEAFKSKD